MMMNVNEFEKKFRSEKSPHDFQLEFGQIFYCVVRILTYFSDKDHTFLCMNMMCGHFRGKLLYFVVSGLIFYIYCVSFWWFDF